MQKIIIPAFMFFLFSCGGGEEKNSESSANKPQEKDTAASEITVEPVDTLYITPDYKTPYPASLKADEKKLFKKYLNDSLAAEVFAMKKAFDSVATEKQMKIYYDYLVAFERRIGGYLSSDEALAKYIDAREGKGTSASMAEEERWDYGALHLEDALAELPALDKHFNGLSISCVAECTELDYVLISDHLYMKAKTTSGKADDEFFEMIIDYHTGEYDPSDMNAKWFNATWDYGGESLLGNGAHLEYLVNIQGILERSDLFKKELGFFRDQCIWDITDYTIFSLDTKKILSEIEKIMKEVKLSAEEKKKMEKRKKEFQNHKGNSETGEGIQVGCESGDCMYG